MMLQRLTFIPDVPHVRARSLHSCVSTFSYLLIVNKTNISNRPTIIGDDVNGGTVFVPRSTANISQSNTFLKDQFPSLNLSELAQINQLYPFEGTPVFAGAGAYWRQASNAYGVCIYLLVLEILS
jgi:hypothetical protein